MTIDWIAKLRHLLQTVAFCLTVSALQVAFNPERSYGIPVTYSLAIGSITWLLIDFGRHFVPSSRETGWPQGAAGLMLPLVGIVTGYVGGTLVGDAVWGFSSWSEQARPRLVGSVLVTLLAGVIANFYFYSVNRGRYFERRMSEAQARATEARLKLLESQLEPHMLFNTLANLRVLIGMDPPRAQAMLDRLIAFLRSTLDASRTATLPLASEFDRLADYLALMAVRMGPRLQVALDLPDELRQLPMPPLLLQPLVENSIKHGLEPKVAGGRIEVTARRDGTRLRLSVRDTGVGLGAASVEGTRFGLQQVRDRLAALHGDAASLTLQAAPDADGGTLAEVMLPLATEPGA